jgi:hypothetical protein
MAIFSFWQRPPLEQTRHSNAPFRYKAVMLRGGASRTFGFRELGVAVVRLWMADEKPLIFNIFYANK